MTPSTQRAGELATELRGYRGGDCTYRELMDEAADLLDTLSTPPQVTGDDVVERVARAICEARGENPDGSQVRFVEGEMHSATFLEIARNDARAAIAAMPKGWEELVEVLTDAHETLVRLQVAKVLNGCGVGGTAKEVSRIVNKLRQALARDKYSRDGGDFG